MRQADWLVDIGPEAGEQGGRVLYSGPPDCKERRGLPDALTCLPRHRASAATATQWAGWSYGTSRTNNSGLAARFPLGVFADRDGRPVRAKSGLIESGAGGAVGERLGHELPAAEEAKGRMRSRGSPERSAAAFAAGSDAVKRLVCVDQKPIGRTPRSNLATYTGLFDRNVRKLFAETRTARPAL